MKVLIAGCNGQLGWELQRTAPAGIELVGLARPELDITDEANVAAQVDAVRPDVIVNAAAYTAVDRAETEQTAAFAANGLGAGYLARAARRGGARLVHISTDFVFDGMTGRPYRPQDEPAPLGVYGASKLDGERRVQETLDGQVLILRTAWVYSSHGNNFVKTMLRLMREREELGVVSDQIGSPTWARGLAEAIWRALDMNISGLHHWTDAGVASWYDFAQAIQEEGMALGLLSRPTRVRPIRTEDYPTPARRPACGVLDKTATWAALDLRPAHWRHALRQMLQELKTDMPRTP